MTETTSSADGSQALTSGSPQAGTSTTDGQAPVSQTTPADNKGSEYDRIIAELRKENAAHRKKLSVYEETEKQQAEAKRLAEEAQLSEIDRVKKQHADIQAQHNAVLLELQETRIQHAVERAAHDLRFIHPEIAGRLLDRAELEFEDNGAPKNAKQLLEKLLKAMPELAHKETPAEQPAIPQSAAQIAPTRPGTPALPAMNPGRTQITPPGVLPPGQRVTLADIRSRRK